jgi:hypothetical protein
MASEKNLQELFHGHLLRGEENPGRPSRDGEGRTVTRVESRLRTTRDRDRGACRLEKVFKEIDETPSGKTCDAIIG